MDYRIGSFTDKELTTLFQLLNGSDALSALCYESAAYFNQSPISTQTQREYQKDLNGDCKEIYGVTVKQLHNRWAVILAKLKREMQLRNLSDN